MEISRTQCAGGISLPNAAFPHVFSSMAHHSTLPLTLPLPLPLQLLGGHHVPVVLNMSHVITSVNFGPHYPGQVGGGAGGVRVGGACGPLASHQLPCPHLASQCAHPSASHPSRLPPPPLPSNYLPSTHSRPELGCVCA